ncbi:MAG TPA: ParB/RepB/Spo0J family partition protein [Candidatus Paceibacterota bacterium]|nr:ParB/RepB/Spo0J family partition protein [Candidatus Paceibacterota bacterium]HMP19285.1 ParB/RepB/Spo0J family partition protein [Candidatus Paceibacterota bacterium]HMP85131.1 ParB/RepB/Spo0J family partition protein [Candidatus Paceibacterota bacterium]
MSEFAREEKSVFQNNAVFFIEVDKIHPNPYQPRREFDQSKLNDLASSIRAYGVLQPLVVTRVEKIKSDGGISAEYELIAGERRLRASKIAGLREVPVLIRSSADDEKTKLELAIIENLQREDLNPIDRARAFQQLADQFGFKHSEIAKKMGKSREYVTNTIRMLALPEEILTALSERKISEGHTRSLLMLSDRPQEQNVLFREIVLRKLTVRDAEKISRKIAYDKVRKKDQDLTGEIVDLEEMASKKLGAPVHIEPRENGGRIRIDYLNEIELKAIMSIIVNSRITNNNSVQQDIVENNLEEIQNSTEQQSIENATPLSFVEQKDAEWEVENTPPSDNNSQNNFDDTPEEEFSLDKFGI